MVSLYSNVEVLHDIFEEEGGLKSIDARPIDAGGYVVTLRVWSPSDGGVPSNWPRRWSDFVLNGVMEWKAKHLDFENVIFRQLMLNAGVSFSCPKE